jgi:hypothetical protein
MESKLQPINVALGNNIDLVERAEGIFIATKAPAPEMIIWEPSSNPRFLNPTTAGAADMRACSAAQCFPKFIICFEKSLTINLFNKINIDTKNIPLHSYLKQYLHIFQRSNFYGIYFVN